MARHPKLRRKDLRKPDEFITFTRKAAEFARANATVAAASVVILSLLIVGIAGFSLWKQMQRGAANVAFGSARDFFVAENYDPAVEAFEQVAQRYPGTIYGRLAFLYAGHAALAASHYEEAATLYQRFLEADPPTEYLHQEALVRLGLAEERAGRLAEARRAYEEAQGLSGPFTTQALFRQAHTAHALADRPGAQRLYKQLLDSYPDSELTPLVRSELAGLSASGDAAAGSAAPSP